MRIRDLFHFSVEIPDKTKKPSIMHNPNDYYVALEINHDGVKQSDPMNMDNLKTGDVKVAKLTIDFTN